MLAPLRPATKCTVATSGDSPVAKACAKGGRDEAKKVMKEAVKTAKANGKTFTCEGCHKDLESFTLTPNAKADFPQADGGAEEVVALLRQTRNPGAALLRPGFFFCARGRRPGLPAKPRRSLLPPGFACSPLRGYGAMTDFTTGATTAPLVYFAQ